MIEIAAHRKSQCIKLSLIYYVYLDMVFDDLIDGGKSTRFLNSASTLAPFK